MAPPSVHCGGPLGHDLRTAQKLGIALIYIAMPLLGAGYAIVEHQEAKKGLTCLINKPHSVCWFLRLFRIAASVLKQLNGVCISAQAKLHKDYGKAFQTV